MNTPREHFSDEILNAYIDGELGPEEISHITAAMKEDDLLQRRVSDLKKISELVRTAFQDTPTPGLPATPAPAPAPYWRIAATVAFLGLSSLLGWHIFSSQSGSQTSGPLLIANNPQSQTVDSLIKQTKSADGVIKVLFHISRNDEELFSRTLDEADRLLSNNADAERPVRIRIVASHGGLAMFQRSHTEHGKRVREIKLKYKDQVDFVGCGETLNYMQSQNLAKKLELFPEVVMVDSGVADLLRRQQEGWTFILI